MPTTDTLIQTQILAFSFFIIGTLLIFRFPLNQIKTGYFLSFFFGVIPFTLYLFIMNPWEQALLKLSLVYYFLLAWVRPINSVGILISLLIIRPWEILPDEYLTALPRIFALIAFIRILLENAFQRSFKVRWNSSCTYVVLFSTWLAFSLFNYSDGISSYFGVYIKGVILFFLTLNGTKNKIEVESLESIIFSSVLVITILGFLNTNSTSAIDEPMDRFSATGILANSNDIAALIILILPFSKSFIVGTSGSHFYSTLRLFCLSVLLYALWKTQSRGAFFSIAAMGLFWAYQTFRLPIKSLFVLGALAMIFSLSITRLSRSENDLSESTFSRVNYWKAGLSMATHYPILGVGFGNYPNQYENYAGEIAYEWGKRTAHSSWILVLAESGFMGCYFFFMIFRRSFQSAWTRRKSQPELLYSLIGYTTSITFLSHSYTIFPMILASLVSSSQEEKV